MDKKFLYWDEKYCSSCGSNELKKEKNEKFCRTCGTVQDDKFLDNSYN